MLPVSTIPCFLFQIPGSHEDVMWADDILMDSQGGTLNLKTAHFRGLKFRGIYNIYFFQTGKTHLEEVSTWFQANKNLQPNFTSKENLRCAIFWIPFSIVFNICSTINKSDCSVLPVCLSRKDRCQVDQVESKDQIEQWKKNTRFFRVYVRGSYVGTIA